MTEQTSQTSQREWGELGKKVMEFRRRLPAREQTMFDDILHAAFKGSREGDVEGYGWSRAEINRERWPDEPPAYVGGR